MQAPLEVRALDLSDRALLERLHRVQRDAYSAEADLLGDDRIPPLGETVDDLAQAELSWLGGFRGELVGALAWTATADAVDIERLVVDPKAFRSGVGRALVELILLHAAERTVTVATGRLNQPARSLYERLGFEHLGDREVVEGLWISEYHRG